jgi:hypothetical protein
VGIGFARIWNHFKVQEGIENLIPEHLSRPCWNTVRGGDCQSWLFVLFILYLSKFILLGCFIFLLQPLEWNEVWCCSTGMRSAPSRWRHWSLEVDDDTKNVVMRRVKNTRLRFLCRPDVCHVVTVYLSTNDVPCSETSVISCARRSCRATWITLWRASARQRGSGP